MARGACRGASRAGLDAARKRLAYDEIFANQLALMLLRQSPRRKRSVPLAGDRRLTAKLQLPYQLTGAQRRVIEEIRGDMAQDVPMLRLLQGDVGSGKTLVALLAMLDGGRSRRPGGVARADRDPRPPASCDPARPARQPRGAGRDPHRPREGQGAGSVLMGLADGSIDILVGTHAIFQEKVAYKNLGLAVIDEQHRFGVSQRLLLPEGRAAAASAGDDRDADPAHADADPIWRDGRQPDRRDAAGPEPVETRVISDERLGEVIDGLGRHIAGGGQAYWVCPLVEESEKSDAAAAEERARVLKLRFGEDKSGWSTAG